MIDQKSCFGSFGEIFRRAMVACPMALHQLRLHQSRNRPLASHLLGTLPVTLIDTFVEPSEGNVPIVRTCSSGSFPKLPAAFVFYAQIVQDALDLVDRIRVGDGRGASAESCNFILALFGGGHILLLCEDVGSDDLSPKPEA